MGAPTGTLTIMDAEQKTLQWNGVLEDREAARAAFEAAMKEQVWLATVIEGPRKARQVRTFAEVEEVEAKTGTVEVMLTHGLVGG